MARDLFGARASLPGHPDLFRINRLDETGAADTQRLPHTVRILLEGLLRNAGGLHVREEDVLALAGWPDAPGERQAGAVLPRARAPAGLHRRARGRRPRRDARGDGARRHAIRAASIRSCPATS